MASNWKHLKTVIDSDPFELEGLNIWEHEWKSTGKSINIRDPLYSQDYTFNVFEISDGTKVIRFAAGEYSNCVWGIYQEG